jgi:hypothetical protein
MRLPDQAGVEADIDRRLTEIGALAECDDFAGIERIVRSLPELTAGVSSDAREAVVVRIREFLAGIQAQAESRRDDIRESLSTIRTGRAATSAYLDAERLG